MTGNDTDERPVRYYFAFTDEGFHAFRPFLRKGFRHVLLLRDFDNGAIMQIEPARSYVCYGITDKWPLHQVLSTLKANGYRIVMIHKVHFNGKIIKRGLFITCASYLAYTIGLPFRGCTPYQLYKKLIKSGGTEI